MAYRYTVEVSHSSLGKYRVISGTDYDLVQAKARAQELEWQKKYEDILADRREKEKVLREKQRAKQLLERSKEAAQREKEAAQREIEEKFEDAEVRTNAAKKEVEALRDILRAALRDRPAIDWEKLKKQESFSKPQPAQPVYLVLPQEPQRSDSKYHPRSGFVSTAFRQYGTVLNEGASRGILVTTSDYGPDSYDFAKGKPLVLLNGANLLNLMEKHGHKAKIDLKEAKTILGEQP